MNRYLKFCLITLAICLYSLSSSFAIADTLTDLSTWTLVEDPAHPNFSSTVDNASQITLSADGAVPLATDIGYQSINGMTAEDSTSGCVFDPGGDFSLAIDYDFSKSFLAAGGLTLGFGIGEDSDGMNSAGIVFSTTSPGIIPAGSSGGAARIDDVDQFPLLVTLFSPYEGSFFVSYEASSGDITVGIGLAGAAVPEFSNVFSSIQQSWNDKKLFPSFFLRSDNVLNLAWASGSADAVFSDFRVLEGTHECILIPEPASLALAVLGCLGMYLAPKRRKLLLN